MVKSEIKVVSYEEFEDFFNITINGNEAKIDAGTLAGLVGEYNEPWDFVGNVYQITVG